MKATTTTENMTDSLDFEAFFIKYKLAFGVVAVIALLIPLSFGGYLYYQSKTEKTWADKIFEFEQAFALEKEIQPKEILDKLKGHLKKTDYFKGNFPLLLSIADRLVANKAYAEAEEVLTSGMKHFAEAGPYFEMMLVLRLSVVFEDSKKTDQGIELLEKILAKGQLFEKGRFYLDLGRFYLVKGNKEQAKEKFEYVINNFDDENNKKIASLYLSKL